MPTAAELHAATVLYTAASSPCGIIIKTNDIFRAKQLLYQFRKKIGDETLSDLQVRLSPDSPLELWILKKAKVEEAPPIKDPL